MIPSAVFVVAVALQNKFPLFSKFFEEILEACQRHRHMFCRPREVYDRVPREKLWGMSREYGVDGCLLLAVK